MSAQLDLKDLLRSKGKTQSEVGLAQSYVSNIITGRVRPGAAAIRTLAESLGCTTDQVFAACDESWRRAHVGDLGTIDQPAAAPSAQGA